VLRDDTAPRWVGRWFRGAALYGTVALLASLLASPAGAPGPPLPPLAFAFTALAFQIVFWIIGGDPVRYRPVMLAGVAEKLAFGAPALWLIATGGAVRDHRLCVGRRLPAGLARHPRPTLSGGLDASRRSPPPSRVYVRLPS
jgi:hypothetical protein